MMRRKISQIKLTPLPQEPVNLNWDHLRTLALNQPLHLLNSHHSRCPNLRLQLTISNLLFIGNFTSKLLTVLKNPFILKHLGNSVIRIHSELRNIFESSQTALLVFPINVPNQYLRSLVEMNLPTLINHMVLKIRKILSQNVQQTYSRLLSRLNYFYEWSLKLTPHYATQLSKNSSTLFCLRNFHPVK